MTKLANNGAFTKSSIKAGSISKSNVQKTASRIMNRKISANVAKSRRSAYKGMFSKR